MEYVIGAIIGVVLGVLGGAFVGIWIGRNKRIKENDQAIGEAKAEAERIVSEAVKNGEAKCKELLVEAKAEILKSQTEAERENKERRQEILRLENKALAKEETLERKLENFERKDEMLNKKIRENEKIQAEIEQVKNAQLAKLEEISGYTCETAKAELVSKIETDAKREAAIRLSQIETELHDTADERAKNIISLAIQRLASDQVSETTVSVVPLPSDEMKGREADLP